MRLTTGLTNEVIDIFKKSIVNELERKLTSLYVMGIERTIKLLGSVTEKIPPLSLFAIYPSPTLGSSCNVSVNTELIITSNF